MAEWGALRACERRFAWRDVAFAVAAAASTTILLGAFVWMVVDLAIAGAAVVDLDFLIDAPSDGGRAGGIGPILVSTAWIVGICIAVALPIGLATAVRLFDARGRSRWNARFVHSLDLLAAMPSIVLGLFGNVLFCDVLGLGFSLLSGGLTLACMVLPTIVRTSMAALAAVPSAWRDAADALALSRTTTLWRVELPAAAPGIAAGVVLGVGRALAETAALVFTSGTVTRLPGSVFDSGRTLSVHIYELAMNVPGGAARASATALVLILSLALVNALANVALRRLARPGVAR